MELVNKFGEVSLSFHHMGCFVLATCRILAGLILQISVQI